MVLFGGALYNNVVPCIDICHFLSQFGTFWVCATSAGKMTDIYAKGLHYYTRHPQKPTNILHFINLP